MSVAASAAFPVVVGAVFVAPERLVVRAEADVGAVRIVAEVVAVALLAGIVHDSVAACGAVGGVEGAFVGAGEAAPTEAERLTGGVAEISGVAFLVSFDGSIAALRLAVAVAVAITIAVAVAVAVAVAGAIAIAIAATVTVTVAVAASITVAIARRVAIAVAVTERGARGAVAARTADQGTKTENEQARRNALHDARPYRLVPGRKSRYAALHDGWFGVASLGEWCRGCCEAMPSPPSLGEPQSMHGIALEGIDPGLSRGSPTYMSDRAPASAPR